MNINKNKNGTVLKQGLIVAMALIPAVAFGQSQSELENRIEQLEAQLQDAKAQLQDASAAELEATDRAERAENKLENAADAGPAKIRIGDLTIGGAIRANYVLGDYPSSNRPSRGGDGGNFELDTFRINLDYQNGPYLGKVEYRWYNGYNMLHTGWIGYQIDEVTQVQVGVNRVPFGPGAYGVSNSWFFDQHYYVGLSDDMDLGIKYSTKLGSLAIDLAYYYSDEGQWRGGSRDSARYSYDSVLMDFGGGVISGYNERNQFNARAILSIAEDSFPTELGVSLQYGQLEGTDTSDNLIEDGDHAAASVHAKTTFDSLTLQGQLTYHHYDIEADNAWGSDELIPMGAYDYAYPVAAEAWIAAVSAAYFIPTPNIAWLDSVNLYTEYSSIMKTEDSQNDSDMFIVGAAWARGGWYIYSDIAYSNGNYFVGGDAFTNFGNNLNDEWQVRYNINFGYYF